ncbi:MAG: radical SAM family heme chaperone HemW [Bacilli bacterium]
MSSSVYIHIPFCAQLCNYCDFSKVFVQNQPVDEYLEALHKEIGMYVSEKQKLRTLYIGGGTPSVLDMQQTEKMLKTVHCYFNFVDGYEWTIEANPNDITKEKVSLWMEYGVNRVSVGVQTFHEEVLKTIGRTHKLTDIMNAVTILNEMGMKRISLDLMYALPGENFEMYKETLEKAVKLDVNHLSVYSLILEPKTVFYNEYRKGTLQLVPNEIEGEMYSHTMDYLAQHGFTQYEISNFGKGTHQSEHNKVYWQNESYYGFGVGSHGYLSGTRYSNVSVIPHYLKKIGEGQKPVREENILTVQERMEEEMFLGLRLMEGVEIAKFQQKFGISPVEQFSETIKTQEKRGLLRCTSTHIVLTREGIMLGNDVFSSFLI